MGLEAVARYSPWLVLLVGLATYMGYVGVGLAAQAALRVKLPSPWRQVVAVSGGIGLVSLAIQVVAMLQVATPGVLIGIWAASVACGGVFIWRVGPLRPAGIGGDDSGTAQLTTVLLALVLAVLLVVAVAPSTKIDELYYHMVVPARIVADHGLRFYQEPWEGAIVPQMVYQIAAAPLHAMSCRDASNVVSWCAAATLAWLAWYLVAEATGRRAWAGLVALAVTVGMYPVTNYTAAGPHAPGDLISCSLVLAVFLVRRLADRAGAGGAALVVGVLATGAASMKVSLAPLAAACVVVAAVSLLRGPGRGAAGRVLAGLIAPGLVLYVPLAVWTWAASGSPLGPMLAGRLGPTVYSVDVIRQTLRGTFEANAIGAKAFLVGMGIEYSPLLWLGVVWFVVGRTVPPRTRVIGAAFLVGQAVLVWLFLTHAARFLGGIPQALLVSAAVSAGWAAGWVGRSRVRVAAAVVAFALPWVGVDCYYASQFVPQLAGGAAREKFFAEKVALVDDYRALDRLLPRDAVVLVVDAVRPSLVYAPRLVVMAPADVPPGRPVYLMSLSVPGDAKPPQYPLDGWRRGRTVYEDDHASVYVFRTPGRRPATGRVWVQELTRE